MRDITITLTDGIASIEQRIKDINDEVADLKEILDTEDTDSPAYEEAYTERKNLVEERDQLEDTLDEVFQWLADEFDAPDDLEHVDTTFSYADITLGGLINLSNALGVSLQQTYDMDSVEVEDVPAMLELALEETPEFLPDDYEDWPAAWMYFTWTAVQTYDTGAEDFRAAMLDSTT